MIRAVLLVLLGVLALPVAAQTDGGTLVQPDPPGQPTAPATDRSAGFPSPIFAPEAVAPTQVSTAATDMTEIVRAAHPVVQAVMVSLALAAFVALTVFVQKTAEFALANHRLKRALATLAGPADLTTVAAGLAAQRGAGAAMAQATAAELALAEADRALLPGTRDRTRATLPRIGAGATQSLRAGTGLLASIGAIAPFVGLFGTVFGIMNSFLAIAETRTTNLAVVAPGIAEALLATAVGLGAAIPAVLFYNLFARRLASHRHRLDDLAAALEVLQSRALDRLAARPARRG